MILFTCTNCGQAIYFENTRCESCGHFIGFIQEERYRPGVPALRALATDEKGAFKEGGILYLYCYNQQFGVCNWLVPVNGNAFCRACRLNHLIPDLDQPAYRAYWTRIEVAKHRLVYSLMRMGLPTRGIRFDFVADVKDKKVFTGHDNGLITINITEADDIQREMTRQFMNEPYRTLLGHFRHEVGHYYWDLLIRDDGKLGTYGDLFGNADAEYWKALQRHYSEGAPADWAENYISAYASAHPWEDWAETWAHYMHIMDTFETAYAYWISLRPLVGDDSLSAAVTFDPYEEPNFSRIIAQWLPLTFALNSLNRSMGVGNLYPFIIVPSVALKLSYIHSVCLAARGM